MSATLDRSSSFGTFAAPSTLTLRRHLPGPIERVWSYLTEGPLRRQWLAAGDMTLVAGATFELVWRNDELSLASDERPAEFPEESRATCRVIDVVPQRMLRFDWPGAGEVTLELEPEGDEVVLTVTHRRLPDRTMAVMVGAGWHMHCDILAARLLDQAPESFWRGWARLREVYARQIPA